MEIKDEKLYNILQMNEGCPTADCKDCDYQLEDKKCNTNAALSNYLTANGVVIPTRCKDCWHFIKIEDMEKDDFYAKSKYNIPLAKDMGMDGFCGNMGIWVCYDRYCSEGDDINEMD